MPLPKSWDSKTEHFYRHFRGLGAANSKRKLNSQQLIDELDRCMDQIFHGKPIPPPYTKEDVVKMAKAILYILKIERGLDIRFAKQQYKDLLREIEKEMQGP